LRSKSLSTPIEGPVSLRLQTAAGQSARTASSQDSAFDWRMPTKPSTRAIASARVEVAVRRHLPLVWRLLRRAGLRASDADDGAQDVFWVFAQRLDKVPAVAERAFLVATTLRIASERRRSKWYRSPVEPLDSEQLPILATAPDQAIEKSRRIEMLDEALAMLDGREREVFILSELEELSKTEVALALRIPEGTVASRLQRARQSFHAAVERLQAEKGKLL
jgi:RNA polymerase sigma-70 factor, ECF subfamily